MSDDKSQNQKINLGFDGGPVLSARVSSEELDKLRAALPAGGWHDLTAEDGQVSLNLARVVYLLVDSDAHRVGFGN